MRHYTHPIMGYCNRWPMYSCQKIQDQSGILIIMFRDLNIIMWSCCVGMDSRRQRERGTRLWRSCPNAARGHRSRNWKSRWKTNPKTKMVTISYVQDVWRMLLHKPILGHRYVLEDQYISRWFILVSTMPRSNRTSKWWPIAAISSVLRRLHDAPSLKITGSRSFSLWETTCDMEMRKFSRRPRRYDGSNTTSRMTWQTCSASSVFWAWRGGGGYSEGSERADVWINLFWVVDSVACVKWVMFFHSCQSRIA